MKNSILKKEKVSCVLLIAIAISYMALSGNKSYNFLIKNSDEDIFKKINEITVNLSKENFESNINKIENIVLENQDAFTYQTIFDGWENKKISDFSRVVTNLQDNLSHTIDIQDIEIFKSSDEIVNLLNKEQKILLGIGSILNGEGYEEFKYGKNKILYNEENNILIYKDKNKILDIQQVPREFIAYLLPTYIDEGEVKEFLNKIDGSDYVSSEELFNLFIYKQVYNGKDKRIDEIINNIKDNQEKFDTIGLSYKLDELTNSMRNMLCMFDEDYPTMGTIYKKNKIKSLIYTDNAKISREYINFINELILNISTHVSSNYTNIDDTTNLISKYNDEINKSTKSLKAPSSYRYIPIYK